MNISSHKNIILIIIIVLLAFFGYWFLFLSKKDENVPAQKGALSTQAPVVAGKTQYDKEFVTSLIGLHSVNLDVSVFQSKVYQALSYPEIPFIVDYTRETGRDNPFLPIGVDTNKSQSAPTQVIDNPTPNTTAPPVAPVTTPAPKTSPPKTPTEPAPATTPAPKPKQF